MSCKKKINNIIQAHHSGKYRPTKIEDLEMTLTLLILYPSEYNVDLRYAYNTLYFIYIHNIT